MNQLATQAIVLSRTNYGEADRILTLLTPDYGKLRLIAKGVRRVKSKLAGGIELFSVTNLTYIRGRGDIGTLVSTRLEKYYSNIVTDLDRTMLGYELIKQLNKITEDEAEADYFEIMRQAFEALNDHAISLPLINLWFSAQLLQLGGHTPNLQTDTAGNRLDAATLYSFDLDAMTLVLQTERGPLTADHIKFARLAFDGRHTPKALSKVQGSAILAEVWLPLVQAMTRQHLA